MNPDIEPTDEENLFTHRILVVDDDPLSRDLLKRSIRLLPLEIDEAADGMAALKLCLQAEDQGRPYELVVLDLMMPDGWSGEEIISKIKDIRSCPKVILCTGAHEDPLLNYPESYGFEGVLKKPFSPSQAKKYIAELLGLGGS